MYYQSFTMEVFLLQIIKTKMHTKTACSSWVVFKYFIRKILQFEEYFINFTILKALKITVTSLLFTYIVSTEKMGNDTRGIKYTSYNGCFLILPLV